MSPTEERKWRLFSCGGGGGGDDGTADFVLPCLSVFDRSGGGTSVGGSRLTDWLKCPPTMAEHCCVYHLELSILLTQSIPGSVSGRLVTMVQWLVIMSEPDMCPPVNLLASSKFCDRL